MTDLQENKLAMFILVRDFIATNGTALFALPNFETFGEQFNSIVSEIRSIRGEQGTNREGFALNKAAIKELLIAQASRISRKLVAIAELSDKPNLKSEVNYSKNDLIKTTDAVLKDRCDTICSRANSFQEELSAYNVTSEMIEAFQTLISSFDEAMTAPKTALNERKLITDRLKTLFEEGESLLKGRIDLLLNTIQDEDVNLYKAYRIARTTVKDFGRRKRSVTVKVTDSAGMPLSNVDTTVVDSQIQKKTTEKGGFVIDHMPAGIYTFRFSKVGYTAYSATVIVNDGETAKVNVVMQKILEPVEA